MKTTSRGKIGHAKLIRRSVLIFVLIFMLVTLIWDPFLLIVRKGYAAHKAEIFQFVNNNSQFILEDIRQKSQTRTIMLLRHAGFSDEIYKEFKCAAFMTHGTEGFYYTAGDNPGDVPGLLSPWLKFDGALGKEIQKDLKQVGNEWVWYERGKLITVFSRELEYHTEKICDNLWYYQVFFRND